MPSEQAVVSLTPVKVEMLRWLAELRFLSLPQLARLCCPSERRDLSEKCARRHLRSLFDAGLVDVLPVSRAALAPPGAANDEALLHGSAPNVFALTKDGLRLLSRMGLVEAEAARKPAPAFGPLNSLFLAHELDVRDVRVWLETCTVRTGHGIERWRDGEEAAICLGRSSAPFRVRPDAWFVYRLGGAVLVGLVEVDRGTERGGRRWGEKLEAYAALFANRKRLASVTGYVNARVLVIVPDGRRRDRLCEMAGETGEALAARFWFAGQASLLGGDIQTPCWRQPGEQTLRPLLPGGS